MNALPSFRKRTLFLITGLCLLFVLAVIVMTGQSSGGKYPASDREPDISRGVSEESSETGISEPASETFSSFVHSTAAGTTVKAEQTAQNAGQAEPSAAAEEKTEPAVPTEEQKTTTKPVPTETEKKTEDNRAVFTASISISCETVYDHWSMLDTAAAESIPADGYFLHEITVTYREGDSVYDILKSVCDKYSIALGGSSRYIEGIGNLYEFDCGDASGWMYLINGTVPGVSCSEYKPIDGDRIQWFFTCENGADIPK